MFPVCYCRLEFVVNINFETSHAHVKATFAMLQMKSIIFAFTDPKKNGLVELILQVGVGQLTEQQKDTLVRQLAMLLNVLDSDIKVQKIHAYSDIRYRDTKNRYSITQNTTDQ